MSANKGRAELMRSITARLWNTDNRSLWDAVVGVVLSDAEGLVRLASAPDRVFAEVGCCSRWLRPHQTRWTADGGFALPSGYGGGGYSRWGLPELDWSVHASWDMALGAWARSDGELSTVVAGHWCFVRDPRAHGPARSGGGAHNLAPGPSTGRKLMQLGFRRRADGWHHTAHYVYPREHAYEPPVVRAERRPRTGR